MLGLGLAACAQLLSIFLAGAGHGWVAPIQASLLLWLLTPGALLFAWHTERPSPKILLALLLIAVIADVWLIKETIEEEGAFLDYLDVNGVAGLVIVGLWIALWFLWQGVVITALLSRRKVAE